MPAKKAATSKKGDKEVEDVSPQNVREKAAALRQLASRLDRYAGQMESLQVPRLRILVGNYNRSLLVLRRFVRTQIMGGLAKEALERDIDIDIILKVEESED